MQLSFVSFFFAPRYLNPREKVCIHVLFELFSAKYKQFCNAVLQTILVGQFTPSIRGNGPVQFYKIYITDPANVGLPYRDMKNINQSTFIAKMGYSKSYLM